jgi:nucleoside-diphosphate-sugar epimerase
MKRILVNGAGGFIGGHMVKRLKAEGNWVRGVDLKLHEYATPPADEFIVGDLRDQNLVANVVDGIDEVYQLAADMGGAGYIFTGEHDADVMHNSATINLNTLHYGTKAGVKKFFYSSSACIYPEYNQLDADNPKCSEESAYPAAPDSEYGWEKLFSERLYLSYMRNYGVKLRVARFHNIFGTEGTWTGGKEKAPAAMCRKIAEAPEGGEIEICGDGKQTRSFLYVDECLEGVRRLMESDFTGPVNIGSEERSPSTSSRKWSCRSPARNSRSNTSPAPSECAAETRITASSPRSFSGSHRARSAKGWKRPIAGFMSRSLPHAPQN